MRWLCSRFSAVVVLAFLAGPALAYPPEIEKLYRPALIHTGGIALEAPQMAENGNVIPIKVRRLDSLPAGVWVREVTLFAEHNLSKPIARFTGTEDNPIVQITMRIRLPHTDRVFAVARLSDGRVTGTAAEIRITVGSCGCGDDVHAAPIAPLSYFSLADREKYAELPPNGVVRAADNSVSTFSIDVDTAAYSNVRRFLQHGQLPPSAAVRIEEMINYFPYALRHRGGAHPFTVATEIAPTPWNRQTYLLRVGLAAEEPPRAAMPPANLVFLVDVSGSMMEPNKLPLVKAALRGLVMELRAEDRIAIVVYAGAAGTVLEPTSGADKARILAALERLSAGGSTNGGQGIKLAYALARQGFIRGGINRVLLATDGDFNVGTVSDAALLDLVKRERETGVALTTLGFGMGDYNDRLLERLADAGNGNHAYIDNLREARKVLVEQLGGTLHTVAHDVKIQVMFNPRTVAEYRLIGYENRALKREDFNNDKVDAGEIGAGHRVTALYEIALVGSRGLRIEPSPYERATGDAALAGELARVRLRYKPGQGKASRLLEETLRVDDLKPPAQASTDWRFAAAVAAFGQLLRGEAYTERFGYDEVAALAEGALGEDRYGYRREFVDLVRMAKGIAPLAAGAPGE